jgi:hypothetical protein
MQAVGRWNMASQSQQLLFVAGLSRNIEGDGTRVPAEHQIWPPPLPIRHQRRDSTGVLVTNFIRRLHVERLRKPGRGILQHDGFQPRELELQMGEVPL